MLSVIINTKNAADTLARTLESVEFADEVIVVDQHSTDRTLEIASHHNAKVFLFDDLGRVEPEARNFALRQTTQAWVLVVDADEVVPPTLAEEITRLLNRSTPEVGGYLIPRRNLIFGDWIKHSGWWPDYQLRLFRREGARWERGVHAQAHVVGLVKKLPPNPTLALVHHNYQTVSDFVQRMDRYSEIKVKELGPRKETKELVSSKLLDNFFDEWFRRLFVGRAYLDGGRGVALSFLQSTYELLVELKRWEAGGFYETNKNHARLVNQKLFRFKKDLSYWLADYQVKHSSGVRQFYWKIRRKLKI